MIIYKLYFGSNVSYYSLHPDPNANSIGLRCHITREELDALVPLQSNINFLLRAIYEAQVKKNNASEYSQAVKTLGNIIDLKA